MLGKLEESMGSGLQLYLKRDSGTCVFLRILQNFKENHFLQNTSVVTFGDVWQVDDTISFVSEKNQISS